MANDTATNNRVSIVDDKAANNTDSSGDQKPKGIKTLEEIIRRWDKNKNTMTTIEYLSQKPESGTYSRSTFGLFDITYNIEPRRFFLGITFLTLSGNFDAILKSKQSNSLLSFSQPQQQGYALALNIGDLIGKNRSIAFLIYSGETTNSSTDNSVLVNSETTAKVTGFESGFNYNLNNQGIHRGIMLGGGLGYQMITITDKKITVTKQIQADTAYLFVQLGYAYLFDNNLYLTTFLRGGLPINSDYEGANNEEYSSDSEYLFLNSIFQISLKHIF